MERNKKYTRKDDMSEIGKLSVLMQEDGDIILGIIAENIGGEVHDLSVEFCTSGGRSPNTLKALIDLGIAIEKDNKENPCTF